MSTDGSSDILLCSFISAEDEDTGGIIRESRFAAPVVRTRRRRFHCCQACAWREEDLRQERRLKAQKTFPQQWGQKFVDAFLTGECFTAHEIAFPLFAAVLLLLLCDEKNLVEGSGSASNISTSSSTRSKLEMKDHRVMDAISLRALVLLLINALLAVLSFNLIKKRISRSSGLTSQQLAHFRSLYVPKDSPKNEARKLNYANILSKAIQCKTVSNDEETENMERNLELKKLHSLLAESFPMIYEKYPPTIINEYSLIFKIPGQDPTKMPIMLCAHLDVVPAPINDEYPWHHDPFSGDIIDGIIHGRGAIDNKHNVVGQLGAMEEIIVAGGLPKRTTYISMGHDEEIGGTDGAAAIARYFQEQRVKFKFILDEGTMMISGGIPGIMKNEHIAIVGCTEKGRMNVELTVKGPGGHSSMPPIDQDNPIKIIGKAVVALESNPVPAHFEKGSMFRNTMEEVAGTMSFPLNVICSNFWIFGGLFKHILLRASNGAAASIRTTTAVTKLHGGDKFNVIPSEIKAIVNHRVHPNDTIASVLQHDRQVINDSRVKLRLLAAQTVKPSPMSDFKSSNFRLIRDTVQTVFGSMTVPGIMVGNTDTMWYWDLSDQIFRFSPVKLKMTETKMFHGVNEKISVDSLASIVDFYKALVMIVEEDGDNDSEKSPLIS